MFGWERTSVRLSRSRKKAHAEDRQHYRTNSAWERTPGEVNSSPVPNPVFSRLRCKLIAPPAERLSIGVGVAARRADVAPTTTMSAHTHHEPVEQLYDHIQQRGGAA